LYSKAVSYNRWRLALFVADAPAENVSVPPVDPTSRETGTKAGVISMLVRSSDRSGSFALMLAAALASGCAAEVAEEEPGLGAAQAALLVTNCTGANISAAVAAGGDVVLDCGTTPITVQVPPTTVTVQTRLRALRPGTITLRHSGTLFAVRTAITFEVNGIKFFGSSAQSMAVHVVGGRAILSDDSFQQYNGFVVSVHNGSLSVSDCTFANNGVNAAPGFAGSIYSEGNNTVAVQRTTFSNNHSTGRGGAIVAFGGTLTVSESTFVGNSASIGGAIAVVNNGSGLTVTNSTFVGNRATSSGGAIDATVGSVNTIRNCTFSGNTSPRGTIAGPGSIFNSIVVDSESPNVACQSTGSSNIQWPVSRPCNGFRLADPRLGALASNGGRTQTMALLNGSAAIDVATSTCPSIDQRAVARPRDGDGNGTRVCDVGAYER
jgi:predicted outer membrane repeat protein